MERHRQPRRHQRAVRAALGDDARAAGEADCDARRGQIVYAHVADLDAWLARTVDEPTTVDVGPGLATRARETAAAASGDAQATPLAGASAERPAASTGPRQWRQSVATAARAALLFAVSAATGVGLVTTVLPRWSTPMRFVVEGPRVLALTASGRTVWTWPLDRGASSPVDWRGAIPPVVTDLDADGRREVAVPVAWTMPGEVAGTSDEVLILDVSGALRWRITPTVRLQEGPTTFDGPWRMTALAAATTQPGRLWIAYRHHTWRAAFVLEVDAHGAQSVRFVYSGSIFALQHWRAAGRDRLAMGTADFHTQAPALSVLDLSHPPARWPDSGPTALTCDRCPTAAPEFVTVFPNSDVTRARQVSTGVVTALTVLSSGALSIDLSSGGTGMPTETVVVLSPALVLTSAERTELHWTWHRTFESDGRLDHVVETCPDVSGIEVHRWASGQWIPHRVASPTDARAWIGAQLPPGSSRSPTTPPATP